MKKAAKKKLADKKLKPFCGSAIKYWSISTLTHILLITGVIAFSYHASLMTKAELNVTGVKSKLEKQNDLKLVSTPKEPEEQAENAYTNKLAEVESFSKAAPHAKYFDKISNEDYEVTKSFSYDHFETIFGVHALHEVIISPAIAEKLQGYDIFTDQTYLDKKEIIDDNIIACAEFFRMTPEQHEQNEREKYEIRWVSAKKGFGMFAKKDIPDGEIIGIYACVVVPNDGNNDYMWVYPTTEFNGTSFHLGCDAIDFGNYLRFGNHAGPKANVGVN